MGPKGINWTEAFQFYCETIEGRLPSYQDVADKFKVSKTEVGQKALEQGWIKLRQELYEKGKNKFLEDKSITISQSETRQLKKWREIQDLTDCYLKEINTDNSLKFVHRLFTVSKIVKIAIEGERTVLGLPNTSPPVHQSQNRNETVEIPPEVIQEIDHLFMLNSHKTI